MKNHFHPLALIIKEIKDPLCQTRRSYMVTVQLSAHIIIVNVLHVYFELDISHGDMKIIHKNSHIFRG